MFDRYQSGNFFFCSMLFENIPFSALCELIRKFAYPCDINPRGNIRLISNPFSAIFRCYITPFTANLRLLYRRVWYATFKSDLWVWRQIVTSTPTYHTNSLSKKNNIRSRDTIYRREAIFNNNHWSQDVLLFL